MVRKRSPVQSRSSAFDLKDVICGCYLLVSANLGVLRVKTCASVSCFEVSIVEHRGFWLPKDFLFVFSVLLRMRSFYNSIMMFSWTSSIVKVLCFAVL